jgi:hypothetical protein
LNHEDTDKPAPTTTDRSTYPLNEIEQRRKVLLSEISRIDNWTNAASDNGLFEKISNSDQLFEEIQDNIKLARTHLYGDNLTEAEYYTSRALRAYDKALYSSSVTWRLRNVYAFPIWIYLTGFLIAILVFYFVQADKNLQPPIESTALYATTWGAVGGILRGIWYLKDKVSDRKYRNSFQIYFLSVPFLGALFGALVYLIFLAGTIIILPSQAGLLFDQTPNNVDTVSNTTINASTSEDATEEPDAVDNQSQIGIIFFSALGGFNWEWTVMIFKRIGDSFKGEVEPDLKLEK